MNKLQEVVNMVNEQLGREVFVRKDGSANRYINIENRYEGNDLDITQEGSSIVISLTGHRDSFTEVDEAVFEIVDLFDDYGLPKNNPKDVLQILGKQIKLARVTLELTQEQLAAKAGLSRVLINQIESGEANVTVGSLIAIAAALNMVLDITFTNR